MTDDLQAAYRSLLRQSAAAPRTGCVPPDDLVALAERRLPEAERLRLLAHVMSCEHCRSEFELLRAVASGRPRARRPLARVLALAASLLVIAGVGGYRWLAAPRGMDTPVLRGGAAAIAVVGPDGPVSAGTPTRLAWRPVPDAHLYDVELLDSESRPVFTMSTTDTTVTVPDTLLGSGVTYHWWVRTGLPDGSERATDLTPLVVERR